MKQIKLVLFMVIIFGFIACPETKKKDDTTTLVGLVALQQSTPSPSLRYSVASTGLGLEINTAMSELSPVVSNFTATSYSVSPALPTGITLDTTTGVISGTPTASVLTKTSYTITANGNSTIIKLLVGNLTSLSCDYKGPIGGCNTTGIPYSCSNDTVSCYRTLDLCKTSSFCY